MRGLTEHDLLSLCETQDVDGAAALLRLAAPEVASAPPDELTLGWRDAALVDVHLRTFGGALEGFVRCPACDEPLAVELGEEDMRSLLRLRPALGEHELLTRGYRIRYRGITCADLEAAALAGRVGSARTVLLERCVLEAWRGTAPVPVAKLPRAVVSVLADALERCDPQAELSLAIACPACGHEWTAALDVPAFLEAEVDAATRTLLDDVHVLARSYGWTESAVLDLGRRRERYVELASR